MLREYIQSIVWINSYISYSDDSQDVMLIHYNEIKDVIVHINSLFSTLLIENEPGVKEAIL